MKKHVPVCNECGTAWPCQSDGARSEAQSALSAIGRIGARQSWANTLDRTKRTAPARAAMDRKFLDGADGDPVRAAHMKKVHYQRLAQKSAATRAAKAAARKAQS